MKNLRLIILTSGLLLLLLSSCGGPKADVNKMLTMYEEYTEVAVKASSDRVIDEKELEELNKIMDKIGKFGDDMDNKYEENEEATKEFESYMSDENNKKIVKNYTKALMTLWTCEGAEYLK